MCVCLETCCDLSVCLGLVCVSGKCLCLGLVCVSGTCLCVFETCLCGHRLGRSLWPWRGWTCVSVSVWLCSVVCLTRVSVCTQEEKKAWIMKGLDMCLRHGLTAVHSIEYWWDEYCELATENQVCRQATRSSPAITPHLKLHITVDSLYLEPPISKQLVLFVPSFVDILIYFGTFTPEIWDSTYSRIQIILVLLIGSLLYPNIIVIRKSITKI